MVAVSRGGQSRAPSAFMGILRGPLSLGASIPLLSLIYYIKYVCAVSQAVNSPSWPFRPSPTDDIFGQFPVSFARGIIIPPITTHWSVRRDQITWYETHAQTNMHELKTKGVGTVCHSILQGEVCCSTAEPQRKRLSESSCPLFFSDGAGRAAGSRASQGC